jgi:hypothetical protein
MNFILMITLKQLRIFPVSVRLQLKLMNVDVLDVTNVAKRKSGTASIARFWRNHTVHLSMGTNATTNSISDLAPTDIRSVKMDCQCNK